MDLDQMNCWKAVDLDLHCFKNGPSMVWINQIHARRKTCLKAFAHK